jgi:hypothetical protein
MIKRLRGLLVLLLLGTAAMVPANPVAGSSPGGAPTSDDTNWHVFLPLVAHSTPPAPSGPRVNAPHFSGSVSFDQTAIFWFGRVTPTDNYVDARLGYDDRELYLHLAIFDRRLWYNPSPIVDALTAWDAVSLYLNLGGPTGTVPTVAAYRFDAQLSDWETRGTRFQAAYRGNGAGWTMTNLAFTTTTGYRWESNDVGGLNNNANNRGWAADFSIPFASLGLSGPPAEGSVWGLGLAVHDRDDAGGTAIADQVWPGTLAAGAPDTWGQLAFGAASYTPPAASSGGATKIRQGLNAAAVPDGMVGGSTVCGDGLDTWTQWGEKNYAGTTTLNVQNQVDLADWPCFSKYYVTFPLDAVPAGKVILSASLTLYQFGNAGDASGPASYIQALTAGADWSESTLTWNNAPQAAENLAGTWVGPMTVPLQWPGVAHSWDVSKAAAAAYAAGQPLRLVLYSADGAQSSGRYFTTSNVEDWDANGRPTLTVAWGDPVP